MNEPCVETTDDLRTTETWPDVMIRVNGSDEIKLAGPDARKLADAVYRVLRGEAIIIEVAGCIYRQTPGEELS